MRARIVTSFSPGGGVAVFMGRPLRHGLTEVNTLSPSCQACLTLSHPHRHFLKETTVAPDLACETIGATKPTDRRTPEGATVSHQSIAEWVICATSNLLPSQSRTLAALVAAAVRTERPNLASI